MPGGVTVPLSDKAQRELAQRYPGVSLDRVNRVVEEYRIYRDHQRTAPTPKQVRAELERIVEQAGALKLTLGMATEESEDFLWPAAYEAGYPEIVPQVREDLARLLNIAKLAFNETPTPKRGRQPALEGGLIRNLARILSESGLAVDATPNGALCNLAAITLEDTGKNIADIPDLITRSLAHQREN